MILMLLAALLGNWRGMLLMLLALAFDRPRFCGKRKGHDADDDAATVGDGGSAGGMMLMLLVALPGNGVWKSVLMLLALTVDFWSFRKERNGHDADDAGSAGEEQR